MEYLSCDFETNNSPTECRVWLYGIYNIYTEQFYYGRTIKQFWRILMKHCSKKGLMCSFHNLKFDGEFLLSYLLQNGYKVVRDKHKKELEKNEIRTLISDMGQWYSIDVCIEKGFVITFIDTLKLYPFKLSELASSFKMEVEKGEIDYEFVRPEGYQPSEEEIDYVKRDVMIAGKAWRFLLEQGEKKITSGSNALEFYKNMIGKKKFNYWFPTPCESVDTFVRHSYRGGWTYANPMYRGKEIGKGIILDVNSLYPSRMKYELLPYGEGKYYQGGYKEDKNYPLYVQRFECSFEIKEGFFPTIQIHNSVSFMKREYVESSQGEIVELTLTSVDLKLFFDHYDVKNIYYLDGIKYRGSMGMFDDYVDYWMEKKIESSKNGDHAMRTHAKLKMNALYGKFAKRPKGRSKYPYLEDGILRLEAGEIEDQNPLYIPMGTFITAYARNFTIRSAQAVHDRFLYADTDSLHLIGEEPPENLEIDDNELGKWKCEGTFVRAKYIGAKCYIEDINVSREALLEFLRSKPLRYHQVNWYSCSKLSITCAGLPDSAKDFVTFENFEVGSEYDGKLSPKHVENGVMLARTTFTIKER